MKNLFIKYYLLLAFLGFSMMNGKSQVWSTDFGDSLWNDNHVDIVIYSLHVHDNQLVLSGSFEHYGMSALNYIASWDSTTFNSFGLGLKTPVAYDLIDYNGSLYAAGTFQGANGNYNACRYLTRWKQSNSTWVPVGDLGVLNHSAECMVKYHDTLYVGGTFSMIGSSVYLSIAGLNGSTWNDPESISPNWAVDAMCVYNDELFIGGNFTIMGSEGWVSYLGRWDGTEWRGVGDEVVYSVVAMYVDTINNFLYVSAGIQVEGEPFNAIGMYDGYEWHTLGDGIFNSTCKNGAMALYRGNLYVGGIFNSESGSPGNHLAMWNWTTWKGFDADQAIRCIAEYKDELYVGGDMTSIGGMPAYGIARLYRPPGYICSNLQPRVFCNADTIYMQQGNAEIQFYNNNAYSETWTWDFGDSSNDSIQNPLHTYTDTGSFDVCVTVTYEGCEKTECRNITVLNGTGLEYAETIKNSIKIYPNPSHEQFAVEVIMPESSKGRLEILGLTGSVKNRYPLQNGKNFITVPVLGWKSGTYLCNFIVDDKLVTTEKLIVQK